MSKGSKIVQVRVPDDLLKRIEEHVSSLQLNARGEPPTVSSYIRKAIEEKLAHRERSRKKR